MPVPDCFFCVKEREHNPSYAVDKGFIPARMDGIVFDVCHKHLLELNEKAMPQVTSEGKLD
jgi:hypothetical protein